MIDQTTIRTPTQTITRTEDKPTLDAFRQDAARENAEQAGNHPDPNVTGTGCRHKINDTCFDKDLGTASLKQALGFVLEKPRQLHDGNRVSPSCPKRPGCFSLCSDLVELVVSPATLFKLIRSDW